MLILVFGLTWRSVIIAVLLFLVTFTISLVIVSIVLVKIPATYFQQDHPQSFLSDHSPTVRMLAIIGKNLLGVVLVVLGIIMSVPGVPGQGILTILLGIMLLDFPGRRKLEYKLVSRPAVFKTINKLRHKFGKPEIELD